MSHYFTIYGLNHPIFKAKLIRKLVAFKISIDKIDLIKSKFDTELNITDVEKLADYLYPEKQIDDWSIFLESIGFNEIFHFSDKVLGRCFAQLAAYINCGFSFNCNNKSKIPSEGCGYILKKDELLYFVNWIHLVNNFYQEESDYITTQVMENDLFSKAKDFYEKVGFRGDEETEAFGWHYFAELKKSVEDSNFDYYYWENSF